MTDRKVIEAFGEDRLRASSRSDESAGPAQQDAPTPCFTTPNPILEGVELREVYARVRDGIAAIVAGVPIERFADWAANGTTYPNSYQCLIDNAFAKADAILALQATPLIGLSQGEGERLAALIRDRDGETFDGEIHLTSAEGEAIVAALSTVQDGSVREALDALEEARGLIQEAKGHDGPNGGFITNHLDFAESWIGVAEAALSTLPQSPAPRSGDAS